MCMEEQNGIFHLALLEDGACAVLQYRTVTMVYGICVFVISNWSVSTWWLFSFLLLLRRLRASDGDGL